MKVVGGLEADDEGNPRVVQEVSRGIALGQDDARDTRKKRPRRDSRCGEKHPRPRRRSTQVRIAAPAGNSCTNAEEIVNGPRADRRRAGGNTTLRYRLTYAWLPQPW